VQECDITLSVGWMF